MTDWDRITEEIQNAMEALDLAQQARENLKENNTLAAVDDFKDQLGSLYDHLEKIKYVWEHEFDFSMDELSDLLSQVFTGRPAAYRHSPRM